MIGGGGSVRPVSGIVGPSASAWLRRRHLGLQAQHRALEEGRLDDLVELIHRDDDDSPPESDSHSPSEGEPLDDEGVPEGRTDEELAREVSVLAAELEERIARVRAETLGELQELDRRVEGSRFAGGRSGTSGGNRGGQFSGYL